MVEDQRPRRTFSYTSVRYGKMAYVARFKTDRDGLKVRDRVIVRSDRGREIGTVLTPLEPVPEALPPESLFDIIRKASPEDLKSAERNDKEVRVKEQAYAKEEVKKLNLSMKVVELDHLIGGERVIIYFVSETRVDFRELVRRLAHEFRTRIELKQVGARDQAKLVGDVGMCGLSTPCRTYLKELGGIMMDMAKIQKHTADPSKITGVCGKLRCCLRFEYSAYTEARDLLPARGVRIETRKGNGVVVDQNLLLREVTILPEGREDRVVVRFEEIVGVPKTAGCGARDALKEAPPSAVPPFAVPASAEPVDKATGGKPESTEPVEKATGGKPESTESVDKAAGGETGELSQQMLQNLELLQMPIMALKEKLDQELEENQPEAAAPLPAVPVPEPAAPVENKPSPFAVPQSTESVEKATGDQPVAVEPEPAAPVEKPPSTEAAEKAAGGKPPEFVAVAKVEEVEEGKGRHVQANGKHIGLFKVAGAIYATDASCPHQGGPLADGSLEGCVLTCPWHQWQFDVTTGRSVSGPSKLATYETKVEGGQIFVRI